MPVLRSFVFMMALVAALLAGCGRDDGLARVSGKVTVDGQVPALGSSITFFPNDGKSRSAGATLENGNYTVDVPRGEARVEIRVPKTVPNPNASTQGPGAGDRVTESLPAKYNDKSELKMTVEAGNNTKDWEVSTMP